MYQNLVVSPLFLKSFLEFEYEKGYSIMANLATEILLCDRDNKLLEEYYEVKEKIKDEPKALLFIDNFINNVTIGGKIKIANNISVKKRKSDNWEHYETEKIIAAIDEWKIILTNDASPEMKMKLEIEKNIELSDAHDYLNPADKSKIRTYQIINKSPGDEFDFRNWIKKYIKDAKNLIIHDGYAFANNEFGDIKYFLQFLPNNSKIQIITLSDEARNRSRYGDTIDGIIAEEKLQELINMFPQRKIVCEFRDEKKLIQDRHIKTDRFFINTGHALGSTYKDIITGKTMCRKQFTITVSKKNE